MDRVNLFESLVKAKVGRGLLQPRRPRSSDFSGAKCVIVAFQSKSTQEPFLELCAS